MFLSLGTYLRQPEKSKHFGKKRHLNNSFVQLSRGAIVVAAPPFDTQKYENNQIYLKS